MKRTLVLLACILISLCLFSCGEEKNQDNSTQTNATGEAKTMGTKLLAVFENEIKSSDDLVKIAEAVANSPACEHECVVSEITEGYLPGFNTEITGFSKAVGFMPMIGSIPFVGYIFQCDTPAELKAKLVESADPRWNICTEADETVCEVSGNYVFFTMCPGEEYYN